MSKSDKDLRYIDCSRASSTLGDADFADDAPINAFDFETVDGAPIQLAVSREGEDAYVRDNLMGQGADPEVAPLDTWDIWTELTARKNRDALNFWYNLNFDAQVLLKGLSREQLKEIGKTNSTTVESRSGVEWTVTYIPKKVLKFRDEHNNTIAHYDISQFSNPYGGNLESDSREWLGDDVGGKGGVDMAEVSENSRLDTTGKYDTVEGDFAERYAEIKDYARRDAEITRKMAAEVVRTAENDLQRPVPMGKPFSTGYVAADWIRANYDHKPGFSRAAVQRLAWDAYAGGRFEVFERGNVGAVAGPDINSAYPAVMSELPDPATLEWLPTTDYDEVREAVESDDGMAFVRATVTTDADRRIQPFAVKNGKHDRVEYPALEDAEITAIGPIFVFAVEAGIVTDFEIETAYVGVDDGSDDVTYPFADLDDMYARRNRYKANGDSRKETLIKIVMNSLYGKTCQTTLQYDTLENWVAERDDDYDDVADFWEQNLDGDEGVVTNPDMIDDYRDFDQIPDFDRSERLQRTPTGDGYAEYVVEQHTAGRLFNPIFASYITGMTRLQLHETVESLGLEDDTYMFATDCIMVDRDAFESSDFDALTGDSLGEWDFDYFGDEAFVVGSGIYEVNTDEGGKKTATRGFKEFNGESLEAEIRKAAADGSNIDVETTRPVTIGDALHLNEPLKQVASFMDTNRALRADMDGKRAWPSAVSWTDLLEDVQYGPPKVFDGDDWDA